MSPDWERAAREGDVDAVRRLVARPGYLDSLNRHGQTALMIAAHRGHDDVVRLLVGAGARLDVTAKYGLSALMLAIVSGHQGIARDLLEAGAAVGLSGTGAPGFAGRTAAELARSRGWHDLADELDEAGPDGDGLSP